MYHQPPLQSSPQLAPPPLKSLSRSLVVNDRPLCCENESPAVPEMYDQIKIIIIERS